MSESPGRSDPIRELIRLASPERLLQHEMATGEGVRVAILDSGIDIAYLREQCRIRGSSLPLISSFLFPPNEILPVANPPRQSTPHGTIVANTLLAIAPRIHLYSADVVGPQGLPDLPRLLRALSHAIHEWKCQIVNLSLGIPEHRLERVAERYQLQRAVEEAYYRDVLLVAAAHNDHPLTRSFPAQLSASLISVDRACLESELGIEYRLCEQIEFRAHASAAGSGSPRSLTTSWACPRVAGLAARLLSLHPGLKPFEIKTLLYWIAVGYQA